MAHLPEGSFWRPEAAAFNAGVRSVIEHAYAAADALRALPDYRDGRQGYARAALLALAEAQEDLILPKTAGRGKMASPQLPAPPSEAQLKGYTGEACSECNNSTLVGNGTCLKCDTCGATTGAQLRRPEMPRGESRLATKLPFHLRRQAGYSSRSRRLRSRDLLS
jgi:hypothetical protein